MFEDDRGRLERIGEGLEVLEEGLGSVSALAAEALWYRLGLIEQACVGLSARYLGAHPEIVVLGLPTLDHILSEPPPSAANCEALARRTLAVFKPLVADPPPPPPPRVPKPNPNSRFDEVVEALRRMEPDLRAQGISALYLFGSVARREDGPESDIDLLFDVDDNARQSIFLEGRSVLTEHLSQRFSVPVDLLPRQALRCGMEQRVAQDLVKVF